ncbi:3-hydroxyisobutyrate dehydrogenase-like beta-hydroxyacid dehydrogenase [Panacagrimonas perspica]|uniref:3-hydroxyisobutyrate dehydrogenase-like beta-hydroxyacid dehydrogenase n=1 Tax=Panacagrimonas perspica TaxID=381431 RepID=A0A4R7PAJ0_9GAMM|nr:3-hydroxyisobutyrate dehydrogenase-like beta-hydroxyacid dehydrogenase [Panacagrimonas perspica]THD01892.1 oxidoreductase [Panacagrimonas perspica]
MKLAFLGLGAMGQAVAANLLKAGHQVSAWNRTATAGDALAAQGARIAANPADACADADVLFSMFADDPSLRAVLIESGLLATLREPLVHVNLATISVVLADELAALHAATGVAYLSAPVVGRPHVAAAAALQILAAGPAAALDRVQPLLDVIGKKTWRLGDRASQANVMKLAVNFMLVSAIETMGEAAALVDAHGVSPSTLIELVSSSIFPGPVYQGYGSNIAEQRYEPAGFKARLGLKDVRLILAAAESESVPLPIASLVRDSLLDALAHGDGDKDWSVLAQGALRRAGRVPG